MKSTCDSIDILFIDRNEAFPFSFDILHEPSVFALLGWLEPSILIFTYSIRCFELMPIENSHTRSYACGRPGDEERNKTIIFGFDRITRHTAAVARNVSHRLHHRWYDEPDLIRENSKCFIFRKQFNANAQKNQILFVRCFAFEPES